MDEFIHWPKPYLLQSATCDEILSQMIAIWMKNHVVRSSIQKSECNEPSILLLGTMYFVCVFPPQEGDVLPQNHYLKFHPKRGRCVIGVFSSTYLFKCGTIPIVIECVCVCVSIYINIHHKSRHVKSQTIGTLFSILKTFKWLQSTHDPSWMFILNM